MTKRIAVMALQGAFIEHERMLQSIGAETIEIRQLSDWTKDFDALVIPGGESTTQKKLLVDLGLMPPVRHAIESGMPVFGTCAGLILLARQVAGTDYDGISTMDINVKRNAYGRQLGSFSSTANFDGVGKVPVTFIRAPYIEAILSPDCHPLATVDGRIVAARQGNQLVTAFHPELTDDTRVHEYFLDMIK